jgi:hypothetical protein
MKPDTRQAMRRMLQQIEQHFSLPPSAGRQCGDGDDCRVCSLKLLEFLDSEVEQWRQRLEQGERPDFGDLARLEQRARKIDRALNKRQEDRT